VGEIGGVFDDDERIAGQRFDGEHVNEMKRQRLTRRAHHVSRYLDRASWRRGDDRRRRLGVRVSSACAGPQPILWHGRCCRSAAGRTRPTDEHRPQRQSAACFTDRDSSVSPLAGEAQQHQEEIDEIEVERQRADNGVRARLA